MSETTTAPADPDRDQLLQMLGNFETVLLHEAGEVRKMIALVRAGGIPPEELTHAIATGHAPAAPEGDC